MSKNTNKSFDSHGHMKFIAERDQKANEHRKALKKAKKGRKAQVKDLGFEIRPRQVHISSVREEMNRAEILRKQDKAMNPLAKVILEAGLGQKLPNLQKLEDVRITQELEKLWVKCEIIK